MPFDAQPPAKTKAAGFVAKAMIHTAPGLREAMLVEMMVLCAEGLRIIQGSELAAETAYQLGDRFVARDAARGR